MEDPFLRGSYDVVDILQIIEKYLDYFNIQVKIHLNNDKDRIKHKKKIHDFYNSSLNFNGSLKRLLEWTVLAEHERYVPTKKHQTYKAMYAKHVNSSTPKCIMVNGGIVLWV